MSGWKLFQKAVILLVDDLEAALRVSALPYAAAIAGTVWVAGSGADAIGGMVPSDAATGVPSGELAALGLLASEGAGWALLINVVVSLWVAVAWHRYILLGEGPAGWLPRFHLPEVLGYLWRSVLVGLLVGVAALGIAIPLGAMAIAIPVFLPLVAIVPLYIGLLIFYRVGMVLPARAVGTRMTFAEAMEATRPHTRTVAGLAAVMLAFPLLLEIPTILDGGGGMVSAVYQGVVGWIAMMVGASTLTTLYGVAVEGRPVE